MKKIETERKYVILKPDINVLMAEAEFTISKITQIYVADSEKTHRIRKRVYSDGRVEYTENTKRRISKMSVIEGEEEISSERFSELSLDIEPKTRPIEKTRMTFVRRGKIYEIDVYPEWQKCCILEVELESEDEVIEFPSFISVVKEVTGMREYSNHSMAFSFPPEPEQ